MLDLDLDYVLFVSTWF